ncbi:hypothetical protein Lalb_Chr20g0117711 [Lupinus albus]|uniref:Uncharacterized protein n=1 Tax=Lupinus albus TaxID=3870 RepID=A0A6A4NCE7_LUPAL|nr:hypothetical protein Lalb_Chr20g0117711 [Lupinus albus]
MPYETINGNCLFVNLKDHSVCDTHSWDVEHFSKILTRHYSCLNDMICRPT